MIRVISIAFAFVAFTLALVPLQLIAMAFDLRLRRAIPHLKVLGHSEVPDARSIKVTSVVGSKA